MIISVNDSEAIDIRRIIFSFANIIVEMKKVEKICENIPHVLKS